jgi:transposase
MTAAEHAAVQKLAHSHTAPAQRVQRAQIIWCASRGESASVIAARVGLDGESVRKRIRRFNAAGLDALTDRFRSGRPSTYTREQTATVIATALTKPEILGLPFAAWTLDRLATYVHEVKGIAMQRSRIDEILPHEDLHYRRKCAEILKRRPEPGDKWFPGEVFIRILGKLHDLWRAVDQHGTLLDVLLQSPRDKRGAKSFLRKLLKGFCYVPRATGTGKLESDGTTQRELLPGMEHRQSRSLNNRCEVSCQPGGRSVI